MVDYATAIRALKDALATDWTTTPVVEENEDPPGLIDAAGVPSPFVFVEIQSDSAEQRSIGSPGSNWFQDTGAISLGTGACVRTWAPHVGRGTPATSEAPEGRWWAVAVSIPYKFLRAA